MLNLIQKIFGSANERYLKRKKPDLERISSFESKLKKMSEADLKAQTAKFRTKLDNGASLEDIKHEVFATVREVGRRVLDMRHYDVQMIGGMVLHEGQIAEMRTGEGKTLVATAPLYLNALEGNGAHLVTVNDYLASRDADWMGRIYNFLGMSVGKILSDQTDQGRRDAYRSDITYGTNNEFGFDYLRDNMKYDLDDYVQRRLNFGIIDEVDSILIDEARTPLIISGQADQSTQMYRTVNDIIPYLRRDEDYLVDEEHRAVTLTDRGIESVEDRLNIENLYAPEHIDLVHHVNKALQAHTLYKRDDQYMVRDGEVVIVDEFTGRPMPGRRWSDGLHQAVEAKEGVEIQNENQTLATVTFQNFFRMYDKLAGMTGTAETEAEEFHSTYGLNTIVVPTNRPIARRPRRRHLPDLPGEVPRHRRADRDLPRARPARARGHDQRGEVRGHRPDPGQEGRSSTTCSTPSSTAPRPRSWPRPGAWRGHHRHEHGRPRHRHRPRRQPRGDGRRGGRRARAARGRLPGRARRLLVGRVPRGVRALQEAVRRAQRGPQGRRPLHRGHRAPRVAPYRQPAPRARRASGRPGRLALLPVARRRPAAPVRRDRIAKVMDTLKMEEGVPIEHPWSPARSRTPRRRSRRATSRSARTCSSTTTSWTCSARPSTACARTSSAAPTTRARACRRWPWTCSRTSLWTSSKPTPPGPRGLGHGGPGLRPQAALRPGL